MTDVYSDRSQKHNSTQFQGRTIPHAIIAHVTCISPLMDFLWKMVRKRNIIFAFLYNRFQQIIVQFVEVTGQQVKDEEHGFNFLWTSGVQMTDYMISERITNIYILKCSSMVSAAAFAVLLCRTRF